MRLLPIYGIRAANGVVVVTTKKGHRNSKNTVSVNAYYGWQKNSVWIKPSDTKTYVNAYVAAETWARSQKVIVAIRNLNTINGWMVLKQAIKDSIGVIYLDFCSSVLYQH